MMDDIQQGAREMRHDVRTRFPEGVKGFKYMGNSHFIELVDKDGHVVKANATGLVRYDCAHCSGVFFMMSNHGDLSCPECRKSSSAKPTWVVPQLSFVPEEQSDFHGGFAHEEEEVDRKDG
jgi:hypothetical protein